MQPAVGIHGHPVALVGADMPLLGDALQDGQQALRHRDWVRPKSLPGSDEPLGRTWMPIAALITQQVVCSAAVSRPRLARSRVQPMHLGSEATQGPAEDLLTPSQRQHSLAWTQECSSWSCLCWA